MGLLWPHCCDMMIGILRHAMANPGAPPAPPAGTPQEDAAGANAVAGTNASSSGAPGGGAQSSAMGSSGGAPILKTPPLFKCGEFGCGEMFEDKEMRDEHQEDCGGLLDGLGEDQVGTK